MANKTLNITMTKSKIGRLKSHQGCLKGLGLHKIRQTIEVIDTTKDISDEMDEVRPPDQIHRLVSQQRARHHDVGQDHRGQPDPDQ